MERINNDLYGMLNSNTKEWQTFSKVTNWIDGTAMTDAKCDGTIFRKMDTEYFRLNWTGGVNVKWFGAKGDGVTDDSVAVQKAINALKTNYWGGQGGGGATVIFPEGNFKVKDIKVPQGINLVSYQLARDNWVSWVPSKIFPAPGATHVFEFEDDAKNCEMIGIYIDADFTTNPNLFAAVRWAGTFNKIINCNFTRCAKYGIKSKCGAFVLQDSNIQGWLGAAPTDWVSDNDFRGAVHIDAAGDFYIVNNEIGAGLPYFTHTGTDVLRDPAHRRICALAATGFMGNSYVVGNLFENGDRGVALYSGLYAYWSGNRYEISGGTGLTTYGGHTFMTFIGERFGINSVAGNGLYPDIELRPGTMGHCSFIAPIFMKSFPTPEVPAFGNQVSYNIDNKASTLIEIIAPVFDPTYYVNAPYDMSSITNLPMKQGVSQYDPNNPRFNSVSTEAQVADPQTGFFKAIRGVLPADGGYSGAAVWGAPDGSLIAQMGFNPGNDVWMNMLKGGAFQVLGGDFYVNKAGSALNSIWSTTGVSATVRLICDAIGAVIGSMTLTPDGIMALSATNAVRLGFGLQVAADNTISMPAAPTLSSTTSRQVICRNSDDGRVGILGGPVYIDTAVVMADVSFTNIEATYGSYPVGTEVWYNNVTDDMGNIHVVTKTKTGSPNIWSKTIKPKLT